jgi:Flp pilus assembly protein TadG
MPRLVSRYRSFIASTRGVAAIEFAMILPVLSIMLLATFDGGNAIAVYMKVRSATFAMAAIANQYTKNTPIQAADMTAITGATSQMLAPYSSSPVVVVISQVYVTAAGNTTATVDWSATLGGTALAKGSSVTLPAAIASSTNTCYPSYPCYLIYSQVSYTYTPLFGAFGTVLTLSDSEYVTPRSSLCVPYVPQTTICDAP